MKPAPTPIAILASGTGSNFEAIADAVASGELNAKILALVCDVPGAPVLAKAKARGIPAIDVPFPPSSAGAMDVRRQRHEEELLSKLRALEPRFLVMAGYMRIVTPRLIEAFRSERGYTRIVNIHPSLLPAFPGVKSYAQAFRFGVKVTGVTVHLVEPDVDSGPICAQEAFSIADCRSVDEVEARGHAVEHRIYSRTLQWVLPESFRLEDRDQQDLKNRRLCVCPI